VSIFDIEISSARKATLVPRTKLMLRRSADPRPADKKLENPAGNPVMSSSYGNTDYLCPQCLEVVIRGEPANVPAPESGRLVREPW
jgi:hypothetical protein